ncbi:MAG: hypothetical protein QM817_01010 [Archangium sp.]
MRVVFALFLDWLYFGDLSRFVQVKFAPLAMLNTLPSLPLTLVGCVAALAVTATLVLDFGQRLPVDWRPRGLIHFLALTVLFVDFTILSARLSSEFPEARIAGVIQALADTANNATTQQQVPTDRRGFEEWVRDNAGPVPLFKDGVPLGQWHVELREDCNGPAATAGLSPPGTLVYCVAPDRRHAWITAVAMPLGQRFGKPEIISIEGAFVGDVAVPVEPEREEPPVWERPTP